MIQFFLYNGVYYRDYLINTPIKNCFNGTGGVCYNLTKKICRDCTLSRLDYMYELKEIIPSNNIFLISEKIMFLAEEEHEYNIL